MLGDAGHCWCFFLAFCCVFPFFVIICYFRFAPMGFYKNRKSLLCVGVWHFFLGAGEGCCFSPFVGLFLVGFFLGGVRVQWALLWEYKGKNINIWRSFAVNCSTIPILIHVVLLKFGTSVFSLQGFWNSKIS